MAYDANEQVASSTRAANLRMFPFGNDSVKPKTFAAGTALLKQGAPVAFNTSTTHWEEWDGNGLNNTDIIEGFLYEDVQLVAGSEVLGQVMLQGSIHFDDIVLPSGEVDDVLLKAACRVGSSLREKGITIAGLDQVR